MILDRVPSMEYVVEVPKRNVIKTSIVLMAPVLACWDRLKDFAIQMIKCYVQIIQTVQNLIAVYLPTHIFVQRMP